MLKFFLLVTLALVARAEEPDPITDQLSAFKYRTRGHIGIMTTSGGAPVESQDAGSTLNTNLLTNEFFLNTLLHMTRERIPVRVVHAKGAGAFGYFISTCDMSHITKAEFLQGVGKVTPVAVRLSMGGTERGGSDLFREPRGYAVKFYTKEGNFDIAGFNTPMFVVRDPALVTSFIHITRKNPATDFIDYNMLWDFLVLHPEAIYMFLLIFSDRGIPDGYRHMPGHSIHTYAFYNDEGKLSYARWHFLPQGGMKNLNSTEALRLGAMNPDYGAKDLYEAINSGNYPTWDVSLQILSEEDLKNCTFDPFDLTKIIPESDYPLQKVGKLVLNRNPKNYFAEVEQLMFGPGNLVPGILGSPDKVYEARRLAYSDAHRYRLGVNFDKIPVNCPYRSKVLTYNRDGRAPVNDNEYDIPNYYPNSFNGPKPYTDNDRPPMPVIYEELPNNFEQARDYYTNQITSNERNRLINNLVQNLCQITKYLRGEAVKAFKKIHLDFAKKISKGLNEKCKN